MLPEIWCIKIWRYAYLSS